MAGHQNVNANVMNAMVNYLKNGNYLTRPCMSIPLEFGDGQRIYVGSCTRSDFKVKLSIEILCDKVS